MDVSGFAPGTFPLYFKEITFLDACSIKQLLDS